MAKKHGKKYIEAPPRSITIATIRRTKPSRWSRKRRITTFDATIEVHLRLGIDPRHADQQMRSTVSLPHGTGKQVRVLVFAQGDAARAARTGRSGFCRRG